MRRVSRRRFLTISAAAGGLSLLPVRPASSFAGGDRTTLHVWRGAALGADAILQLNHPDRAAAERLIGRALAEVERLERILSLYRPDSAVARLNRQGVLLDPPLDLVTLLADSVRFGRLTGGAFDVTVQPLWRLYADHFSHPEADPAGPGPEAIEHALALVDYRNIVVDTARIDFRRPGMAITLNGIAQGYVTDRVVDLLRREGIASAIVDIGEIGALGSRPDATPWIAGVEDPTDPTRIAERIPLRDCALATSGGYGLRFDPAGRFNHLLKPDSGGCADGPLAVSVTAPTATVADALSTAFAVMPVADACGLAKQLRVDARFALPDGSRLHPTG